MRILLVSRDRFDQDRMVAIRRRIVEQTEAADVWILAGEMQAVHRNPAERIIYAHDIREEALRAHYPLSEAELAHRLGAWSGVLPPCLYRADRRFLMSNIRARHLAIEQLYLADRIGAVLDDLRPDAVFMTGGATLIRNTVQLLAEARGIRSYRILPTNFLTPGRAGPRMWFCANNINSLSDGPLDQFGHDPAALDRHAESLIASIRDGQFQLSALARTKRGSRAALVPRAIVGDALLLIRRRDPKGEARRRLIAGIDVRRNARLATDPARLERPYLLFPLNVPDDAQLMLRAPQFVDLFSLCQQIANVLPLGLDLVLREHPGAPGMLDHGRLRAFLRRNPQARFVTGDVELADLLPGAAALVTINSTSGLEAAIADKPVLALGPAFYRHTGAVYDVDRPDDLARRIGDLLADPLAGERPAAVRRLLTRMLDEAWPPPEELRGNDTESVDRCLTEGIVQRIRALQHNASGETAPTAAASVS
jgi:hypothetical protein